MTAAKPPRDQGQWTAYADGSCIGNPGPGGWGVVLIDPGGNTRDFAGAAPATTNNRMEITAVIEALGHAPDGAAITIHSDSQYVIKTMTLGWKRRENVDLWPRLDAEVAKRRVSWQWVRGHAGDPLNERADELARSAAEGRTPLPPRPVRAIPAVVAERDSQTEVIARLTPLLLPGEVIQRCASCDRDFVAMGEARHCALVACQLGNRLDEAHSRDRNPDDSDDQS